MRGLNFLRPFLCLLALVLLFNPLLPVKAGAKPVIVDSKHKFSPGKSERTSQSSSHIISLSRDQEIKCRPVPNQKLTLGRLPSPITSRSAIVMDAQSGNTIYARAAKMAGQPASTIKILTGLLALDTLKKKESVKVSRRAARMPRSKVYLRAGKSYNAGDLINAVLLASANDASVALAEKIGGSERVFASLMTHRARRLGAENTVCRTASGLTARGQKTTARDLAVVFNEIMKNQEFAKRIRKIKVRTRFGKVLRNHNRALWQVSGAEGGKTGYTRLARQTYVGKFKRGQNELLVAIMGSETMWRDINTLVEYGFSCQARLASSQQREAGDLPQAERLGRQHRDQMVVVLSGSRKTSTL